MCEHSWESQRGLGRESVDKTQIPASNTGEGSEPLNLGIDVNVSQWLGKPEDTALGTENPLCLSCLKGPGQGLSKVAKPLLLLRATPAGTKN